MATEEERLELLSTVEDEFTEPLERLEQSLEDVDDEIRQTGRGNDYVRIDVEVSGVGQAVTELEALDAALETIDDDFDIDVGANFDDVLRDDVTVDSRLRGSQFRGGSGRPVAAREALDRSFSDVTAAIDKELGDVGKMDVQAGSVDINTTSTDVDTGTAMTSGGHPNPFIHDMDARTPTGVEIGGNNTPNAAGPSQMAEMFGFLGFEGGDDHRDKLRQATRDLRQQLTDMRFTMGAFHNIFAAMIPMLGTFVGALPAAIVGIGALATAALGAAGALAGIGVLGTMGLMLNESGQLSTEPLMERIEDLGEEFIDAFTPLMKEFAPIVDSLITETERMFQPLANAASDLKNFTDEFRGMIDWFTGGLPAVTATILQFAHAAMPLLRNMATYLSNINFTAFLADELAQALPALRVLGGVLVEMIPAIVYLSQGFLQAAAGLMLLVAPVVILLNRFPRLANLIGLLIGGFLALITVSTLYTLATQGMTAAILGNVSAILTQVGAIVTSYIPSVTAASGTTALFAGTLAAVMTLLGIGLILVPAASAAFSNLAGSIGGARSELEKFADVQNGLGGGPGGFGVSGGSNPYSSAGGTYHDNSTTIIESGDKDSAARQQYSSQYEHQQHVDSVFGG